MTIRLALVDLPDELRNVCYFGHLLYASTYFPIAHYAQCDSMSQIAPLVPPIATLHRKIVHHRQAALGHPATIAWARCRIGMGSMHTPSGVQRLLCRRDWSFRPAYLLLRCSRSLYCCRFASWAPVRIVWLSLYLIGPVRLQPVFRNVQPSDLFVIDIATLGKVGLYTCRAS